MNNGSARAIRTLNRQKVSGQVPAKAIMGLYRKKKLHSGSPDGPIEEPAPGQGHTDELRAKGRGKDMRSRSRTAWDRRCCGGMGQKEVTGGAAGSSSSPEQPYEALLSCAAQKVVQTEKGGGQTGLRKRIAKASGDFSPIEPRGLAEIPPGSIARNPSRFQYKGGTDVEGVGSLLKEQDKYNPDLAGVITVWRDPADGKTYVVNGHHRLELALRTKAPSVAVRYAKANDASEARAIGALQNIAEGRGTAVEPRSSCAIPASPRAT